MTLYVCFTMFSLLLSCYDILIWFEANRNMLWLCLKCSEPWELSCIAIILPIQNVQSSRCPHGLVIFSSMLIHPPHPRLCKRERVRHRYRWARNESWWFNERDDNIEWGWIIISFSLMSYHVIANVVVLFFLARIVYPTCGGCCGIDIALIWVC